MCIMYRPAAFSCIGLQCWQQSQLRLSAAIAQWKNSWHANHDRLSSHHLAIAVCNAIDMIFKSSNRALKSERQAGCVMIKAAARGLPMHQ